MDGDAVCWGTWKPLHGIPAPNKDNRPEKDWVLIVIGQMHFGLHTQKLYQIDFILQKTVSKTQVKSLMLNKLMYCLQKSLSHRQIFQLSGNILVI